MAKEVQRNPNIMFVLRMNMSCFYNLQKEAWRSQLERAILRSSAVRDSLVAGDSTILSFPSLGGRSRAFSVFYIDMD